MKKVFKIGCGGVIALFVLIIVVALMSDGEEKPSTGTSTSSSTESKSANTESAGTKTVDATAQVVDALGLKVSLGEIKIAKNKIQVGVNIENTGDNKVTFYPDQGSAVVGNMQLDANLFLTDGDISGDIQSGVLKEGVIEFLAPEGKEIDVDAITEIKLSFGDVFEDTNFKSQDVSFTVPVK